MVVFSNQSRTIEFLAVFSLVLVDAAGLPYEHSERPSPAASPVVYS